MEFVTNIYVFHEDENWIWDRHTLKWMLCLRKGLNDMYLSIFTFIKHLAISCEELTHWKRLWWWEGLGAGGEGDNPGWDGWMASLTRWTWVWVNSGSWWWTGRPGMLQFMGLQRVGHDWVTELNWTDGVSRSQTPLSDWTELSLSLQQPHMDWTYFILQIVK